MANIIVVAIVDSTALILFIRDVEVDGCRTGSAFPGELRVLSLQLVRHVDLVQMLFQQAHVLAVALERSVCKVSKEWYKTNDKVKSEVEQHHEQHTLGEAAFDLAHAHDEFEGEECIGSVTNGRHETYDGRPTEAHTKQTEQGEIKSVGGLAGSGEDVGLLLGDVGRDLLLDFLRLAWLPGVWDLLVVRVLTRGQSTTQRIGVGTTYIWPSGGLVGVLGHLACEHLLCRILCDELCHDCGVVGIWRGMRRGGLKGGCLAMNAVVKKTRRATL